MENYILLFCVGRHDNIKKKITVFTEHISRNSTLVDPDAFVCLYFHKRNVKKLDNTSDCETFSLQNKGNNL